MRLIKATITGYRSIKEELTLVVDRNVTVILGANDHGKTNLLDALLHLNSDREFDEDDVNWDLEEEGDRYPAIRYELALSDDERARLARLDAATRCLQSSNEARESAAAQIDELEEAADELAAAATEAAEAHNAAQATLDAANAAHVAGETPETREEVVSAQAAVTEAKRSAQATENDRVSAEGQRDRIRLAIALAEARAIEAESLMTGDERNGVVASAFEAAEAESQTAAAVVRRAQTKSKTAAEALEAATATAEPAALGKAQEDAEAAAAVLAAAQQEAAAKAGEANRRAAASDALDLIQSGDDVAAAVDVARPQERKLNDVPDRIVLERAGVDGTLQGVVSEFETSAVETFLALCKPRVELIEPTKKIPDAVSKSQLHEDGFVFMRGIFEYAGIGRDEWDGIFTQNDRTRMRLEEASTKLNETLRASWSQGSKLEFSLRHDSKSGRIDLLIRDPAIKARFARPSRRSSGFTHFFALKTILHALQHEAPASSYIWLFDEPGIYLHPDGQRDLIQVMETLARQNQVVYSTHSIFLANKNYPTRHRLLVKAERGTRLDAKPFVSRWRTALDALGLSLPGTLLFASHVLLVEGDSDAILISAVIRKLIALGRLDLDLNALALIPTGDAQNADALIRMLSEGGPAGQAPAIAVLVDGDDGGAKRLKAIDKLTKERGISTLKLLDGTTTEDHLPAARILYIEALASYLAELHELDSDATLDALKESYAAKFPGAKEVTNGLAGWSREAAKTLTNLEDKPSPVGVARAYANRLEDVEGSELKGHALERALKLARLIQATLDLPSQTLSEDTIVEDGPEA